MSLVGNSPWHSGPCHTWPSHTRPPHSGHSHSGPHSYCGGGSEEANFQPASGGTLGTGTPASLGTSTPLGIAALLGIATPLGTDTGASSPCSIAALNFGVSGFCVTIGKIYYKVESFLDSCVGKSAGELAHHSQCKIRLVFLNGHKIHLFLFNEPPLPRPRPEPPPPTLRLRSE